MKFLYYVLFLFLFLLFSCKKDEKKIIVPSPQKEIPTIDSSLSSNKNIEIDNKTQILDDLVKNILEKKEKRTAFKAKSIFELWQQYKFSKTMAAKYISENNLDSTIVYLNMAANAAYELSREDIATWQLNNIGYYSITEFKKRTDYERRVQQLVTITNLREKGLHLEETKSVFSDNFKILSNAENYLYKAQFLDHEFEKSNRTEIIERNLEFIKWVADFISDGRRTK